MAQILMEKRVKSNMLVLWAQQDFLMEMVRGLILEFEPCASPNGASKS